MASRAEPEWHDQDDVDDDVPVEGAELDQTEEDRAAEERTGTEDVPTVPGGVKFDDLEPMSIPPERGEGRYMGLTLYYPAVAAMGLIEVARQLYVLPRSVVYGVRAVMLSVLFMTLLRKPTLESAQHLRREEFGALIGTDRASCVKTLRRKFNALVAQRQAAEFIARLARRWVEAGTVTTAYLYIDGHMKVYSGKRNLQEIYNTQRRLALPGVMTYFVGDQRGRPLLFLTEELSTNLAKAIPHIIAKIREVVGDRSFTVIFDRGGYDGKLFKWLTEQGIGFITYQRGCSPNLAKESFSRKEARFEGRRVRFWLAEDTVKIAAVRGGASWYGPRSSTRRRL